MSVCHNANIFTSNMVNNSTPWQTYLPPLNLEICQPANLPTCLGRRVKSLKAAPSSLTMPKAPGRSIDSWLPSWADLRSCAQFGVHNHGLSIANMLTLGHDKLGPRVIWMLTFTRYCHGLSQIIHDSHLGAMDGRWFPDFWEVAKLVMIGPWTAELWLETGSSMDVPSTSLQTFNTAPTGCCGIDLSDFKIQIWANLRNPRNPGGSLVPCEAISLHYLYLKAAQFRYLQEAIKRHLLK